MQPAGMLMDWRSWSLIPAADATAPAQTIVISLVRANGQVQDTLTYTVAEAYQAILTAVATQTPQPVRPPLEPAPERAGPIGGVPPVPAVRSYPGRRDGPTTPCAVRCSPSGASAPPSPSSCSTAVPRSGSSGRSTS